MPPPDGRGGYGGWPHYPPPDGRPPAWPMPPPDPGAWGMPPPPQCGWMPYPDARGYWPPFPPPQDSFSSSWGQADSHSSSRGRRGGSAGRGSRPRNAGNKRSKSEAPERPRKRKPEKKPEPKPFAPPDTRLDGVVIDWKESFGFIQFSDGRRAYVHNSAAGGSSLLAGQEVTGLVAPDPKNPGKWQAQSVERKVSLAPDGSGRIEGKVHQWSGNWGFIQFSDGRRAFCHTSAARGALLIEGQAVVGNVEEDPKNPGKWQAKDVEVLPSLAPDNSGRLEGKVVQWNGAYGFIQFSDGRRAYCHQSQVVDCQPLGVGQTVFGAVVEDESTPGTWQAQNVEGEPNRLDGVVSQWCDKGYGFIDFVDGRHAFVHQSACNGQALNVGEAVSAVLVTDIQNAGKWMAKTVIRKGPPGEDCTVTDWREKGGWGFVLLDSGTSAYIHASSFGGGGNLAVGMRLRVKTKYDPVKGRLMVEQVTGVAELTAAEAQAAVSGQTLGPAAKALAAAAAGGVAAGAVAVAPPALADTLLAAVTSVSASPAMLTDAIPAVRLSGKVSEWNPSGFGFVMMDDGRRAYVHNSQCGGQHLEAGELIAADVVPDPRNVGKWAAQNVERFGVPGGAAGSSSEQAAKRPRFGP